MLPSTTRVGRTSERPSRQTRRLLQTPPGRRRRAWCLNSWTGPSLTGNSAPTIWSGCVTARTTARLGPLAVHWVSNRGFGGNDSGSASRSIPASPSMPLKTSPAPDSWRRCRTVTRCSARAICLLRPFGTSYLRLWRQGMELPYVNKHDTRMTPNTFEAYLLFDRDAKRFNYVLGYVDKIRKRTETAWQSLSSAAGADANRGASVLGPRWRFGERANIGAVDIFGIDTFNTFYTEATAALTHRRRGGAGDAYIRPVHGSARCRRGTDRPLSDLSGRREVRRSAPMARP